MRSPSSVSEDAQLRARGPAADSQCEVTGHRLRAVRGGDWETAGCLLPACRVSEERWLPLVLGLSQAQNILNLF